MLWHGRLFVERRAHLSFFASFVARVTAHTHRTHTSRVFYNAPSTYRIIIKTTSTPGVSLSLSRSVSITNEALCILFSVIQGRRGEFEMEGEAVGSQVALGGAGKKRGRRRALAAPAVRVAALTDDSHFFFILGV